MDSVNNQIAIEKLKDQFSEATRTVRRNLLISASAGIILSAHTLKLTSIFGIDLGDETTFSIAVGAISIIATYELLSFVTYAAIDHLSWRINAKTPVHNFQGDRLKDIADSTRQVKDQLSYIRSKMIRDTDSVVDAIKSQSGVIDRICIKAEQTIKQYQDDVANFRSQTKKYNLMQFFRIFAIDWAIPLILGLACVTLNWYFICQFLKIILVLFVSIFPDWKSLNAFFYSK